MSQAQKDAASRQPQGQKAADAAKASGGNGIDVFASVLGSGDLEKGEDAGGPSFYKQINRAYHHHTWQYWFVATLANGLLWAQIVIGAALTACGASTSHSSRVATIYLGASSTIIAGLLTYFKSRNQPNRARQFRQALKGVRTKMNVYASELRAPGADGDGEEKAKEIFKMYDDALKEAETNYPDLWVTIADLKRFVGGAEEVDPNSKEGKELKKIKEIKAGAVRGLDMVGDVGPHASGGRGDSGNAGQGAGTTGESDRAKAAVDSEKHDAENVRDRDEIKPAPLSPSPGGTTVVASDTEGRQ